MSLEPLRIARPELSEELARSIGSWPGRTNARLGSGALQNPGAPLAGQNAATGLALSYGELRGLLLGLTQPGEASAGPDSAVQYFRLGRAWALVSSAQPELLELDQLVAAWLRFLAPPSSVPAAPVAPPSTGGALQAVTDSDLAAGAVVRSVAGGHIELAAGSSLGTGELVKAIAYPAATSGSVATYYPTGSRAPLVGLPVGMLYRSPTGLLVAQTALNPSDSTNQMGISDGVGFDVLVGPETVA